MFNGTSQYTLGTCISRRWSRCSSLLWGHANGTSHRRVVAWCVGGWTRRCLCRVVSTRSRYEVHTVVVTKKARGQVGVMRPEKGRWVKLLSKVGTATRMNGWRRHLLTLRKLRVKSVSAATVIEYLMSRLCTPLPQVSNLILLRQTLSCLLLLNARHPRTEYNGCYSWGFRNNWQAFPKQLS